MPEPDASSAREPQVKEDGAHQAEPQSPSLRAQDVGSADRPPNSSDETVDPPLPPRPMRNSYWATPYLLASAYPFDGPSHPATLDAVLRSGVRTFVDLTEEWELVPYEPHLLQRAREIGVSESELTSDNTGIRHYRSPIPDMSVPVDKNSMDRILDLIEENEREGRKTVVHCFGGIGRTGTVVGCWYLRSGRAKDATEALAMVGRKWKLTQGWTGGRTSPQTDEQFDFVRRYAKGDEEWEGWKRR